jgi:hypothetical protein
VFRRKSSEPEAVELTPAPAPEPKPGAKNAPTPSRKEAEAARKARLTGIPSDPKAAKKAAREADRQARYEARLALQQGDEKRLPARDAGPVKAYVRDYVDGRRSAGELFIPVALVVLLAGFIRNYYVQTALLWAWSAMLIGVVLDSMYIIWRLRQNLPERFPDQDRRGAVSYGVLRSLQIRRLRLPPPKVKANGQPVVPKAAKTPK